MDDLRNNPAPEWVQNIKTAFANLIVKVKEHDDFVTTIEQSDKALLSQQNEELLKRNKRAKRDIEDLQVELEKIEEETRAKEKKAQKQILDSIKQQEHTQEELIKSQRQCAETENSLKNLTMAMIFVREILSAKVASDSGTKTLYKRIEDLAEFISIDLFDSIKHLRVLKLINTTIDDRFFKEWLSRWIVNERKNWIKNKTTIAFVGEFSSGKTSIINLILTNGQKGKNLLSVDNSVTTAIPTYISNASEEKYRFFSSDEKLKEISKDTFYSIDKKVIDRIGSLSSLVKYFVMTYNNPELTAISILDTPGFSSNDEEDSRRTISVINECDACGHMWGDDEVYDNDDEDELAYDHPLSLNDFFPVCGITLNKSTVKDAERQSYRYRKIDYDESGQVTIWAANDEYTGSQIRKEKGCDVFTNIYMTRGDEMFVEWEGFGFDWGLSYLEWVELFKRMGFIVKQTQTPRVKSWEHGPDYLDAKFVARSADSSLKFELIFAYGCEGSTQNSPSTLYSISVYSNKYKFGEGIHLQTFWNLDDLYRVDPIKFL